MKTPKHVKAHKNVRYYDFVVIGGGVAGCFAAIAAARSGLKVAIADRGHYLGGNASPTLGVGPEGAMAMGFNRHSDETGLAAELRDRTDRYGGRSLSILAQILWEMTAEQSALDVFIRCEALKPVMATKTEIKAVSVQRLTDGEKYVLYSPLFADCSGDGDIACKTGALYMLGREGKHVYGESMAPDESDGGIMGATLKFTSNEAPFPVPFTPPEDAYSFTEKDLHEHKGKPGMVWWLEYASLEDVFKPEKLYEQHLKMLFGYWDHLKNDGDHGCSNRFIDYIAPRVSPRESRRFKGDYILTQDDVIEGKAFEDTVAFGGWPIDLHPPGGIFSSEQAAEQRFVEPYPIPYRCLYSKNIDNLFFAGRNSSVSHVALGTTRVIWTCSTMGEAVGHAATLCSKYSVSPREIYKNHIRELTQKLLRADCRVPGALNEDTEDKARLAEISATSSMPLEASGIDELVQAGKSLAQTLPESGGNVNYLFLYVRNSSACNISGNIEFFACGDKPQTLFSKQRRLHSSAVLVPAGHEGWIKVPVFLESSEDKNCWWHLTGFENLEFGLSRCEIIGCQRGRQHSQSKRVVKYVGHQKQETAKWIPDIGTWAFRTEPALFPFSEANIINGANTPEISPNLWISDPEAEMPQEVLLEFKNPETLKEIFITFNTGLNLNQGNNDRSRPECVSEYRLLGRNGKSWQTIAEVEHNFSRRRLHKMPEEKWKIKWDAIKLSIINTRGSASAQVFEIRAY